MITWNPCFDLKLCVQKRVKLLVHMWLDLRKPGFHAQIQIFRNTEFTLQKLKYDIHTKLPLESYQIQFWYDSSFGMIPVAIWYEFHTSVFAVQLQYAFLISLSLQSLIVLHLHNLYVQLPWVLSIHKNNSDQFSKCGWVSEEAYSMIDLPRDKVSLHYSIGRTSIAGFVEQSWESWLL